jgi:hypothetical protein
MKLARLALLGTVGVTLLAPSANARGAQDDHAALHASIPDAGLVREVRRVTRSFVDDPDAAEDAGYAPFLGCVSGGGEAGAMGLHYVNFGLVGDGKLEPSQPEALVYEKRNGRLQLVAVEYYAPHVWAWRENPHSTFVDWTSPRPSPAPWARCVTLKASAPVAQLDRAPAF